MIAETRPPTATRTAGGRVALPLVLTVYDEPVAKGRPRVAVRNGRAHAYTPRRTERAEFLIRQAMQSLMGDAPPFEGPLSLSVVVWLRMPKAIPKKHRQTALPHRRPDLDNYLKTAMDGCSPAWLDDAQVVRIHAEKRYGDRPRWHITISNPLEW